VCVCVWRGGSICVGQAPEYPWVPIPLWDISAVIHTSPRFSVKSVHVEMAAFKCKVYQGVSKSFRTESIKK